jgi:phosphoenolpyruvate-protein phosphotransferase (PTS system enzyme I)
VSILLPAVSGLEDIRRTREVIEQAKAELAGEGQGFDERIPVGAMIEVPSAALLANRLAPEIDFFSLGTNDLTQYLLAADRDDENMMSYYQPLHPAVLRLIASVAEVARDSGRMLTVCGDMAGDPRYTELLLGLGLRELSVTPGEMLDVKHRIRETDLAAARELTLAALELASGDEIERLLEERAG